MYSINWSTHECRQYPWSPVRRFTKMHHRTTIGEFAQTILNVTKKILQLFTNYKQDTLKNGTASYNESAELVTNHPVFNELSLWKSTKIHHINISDPSKKLMAEAYIRIICNVCEKYMVLLDGKTIDELAEIFTPDNTTNMVSNILHEINRQAIVESIPSIFITKNTSIVYEYLESMEETILDIQLYGRWNCKTDKILATLDIIYATVRIIGYRIPAIIRDMNGELSMELKDSKYDASL